jgi:hypothetical protein
VYRGAASGRWLCSACPAPGAAQSPAEVDDPAWPHGRWSAVANATAGMATMWPTRWPVDVAIGRLGDRGRCRRWPPGLATDEAVAAASGRRVSRSTDRSSGDRRGCNPDAVPTWTRCQWHAATQAALSADGHQRASLLRGGRGIAAAGPGSPGGVIRKLVVWVCNEVCGFGDQHLASSWRSELLLLQRPRVALLLRSLHLSVAAST